MQMTIRLLGGHQGVRKGIEANSERSCCCLPTAGRLWRTTPPHSQFAPTINYYGY